MLSLSPAETSTLSDWTARTLARLSCRMGAPTPPLAPDPTAYGRCQYRRAARFLDLFVRPFLPAPSVRLIDLGCGEGGDTRYYATALGELGVADVIGVDISHAKLRSPILDVPGTARFVCGDVNALPLPDGCADVAISRDGFEHFMTPAAVLREANRVLRPGGRLFVCFAPYFGTKGPHLGGFVPVPYAHLFFSVPTLAGAAQLVTDRSVAALAGADRDALQARLRRCLSQALTGVNHITIRRWERLLMESDDWALVGYRKYSGRRLHRPLLFVGLLQELVASVFAVLEKHPGGRVRRRDLAAAQAVALPKVIAT